MKRLAIIVGLSMVAASLGTAYAGAIVDTTASVQLNLRNGVGSAVNWDNSCKAALLSQGAAPNFTTNLRSIINYANGGLGAAYRGESWISSSAKGNASTSITVSSGVTTLPLRINSATFLCRPMVAPDLTNACTNKAITAGGLSTSEPWVNSLSNAEEANPNPIGGNCQWPAKVFDKNQYIDVSIIYNTAGSADSTVDFASPKEIYVPREEDSRYWIGAPTYFNFTSSDALKAGTIGFRVKYKSIGAFHSWTLPSQVQACLTGGPTDNRVIGWNECGEAYSDFWISVVVQSYDLQPAVQVSAGTTVAPGAAIALTSSVTKSGNMTTGFTKADGTAGTNWRLMRLVYPAGTSMTLPGMNEADTTVCATAGYGGFSGCSEVGSYDKNDGYFAVNTLYQQAAADTAPAAPAGTKVCYVTSVAKPVVNSAKQWRHSPAQCVIVATSPVLSIVGADASAGGALPGDPVQSAGFLGAATFGRGFGSVGEYGLFATGPITNFAAAGVVTMPGMQSLMFANPSTAPPRNAGFFTSTHEVPDYSELFKPRGLAGSAALADFGNSSKDYHPTSDVVLPAKDLGTGKTILVYAPGNTVTIGGDITTNPAAGTFKNASNLVIVAKNIVIAANVARVDAVLFAKGVVSTCGVANLNSFPAVYGSVNKPALLTGQDCSRQRLIVNGAVIGRQLVSARTAGGTTSSDMPAEIIRLRPEVFLAPYETGTTRIITTDSETELPPRN